jgi:hypothetical protein
VNGTTLVGDFECISIPLYFLNEVFGTLIVGLGETQNVPFDVRSVQNSIYVQI